MTTGRHGVVASTKGFSLIEMMIVVVIVGIMMALAMPSMIDWIQNSKARRAAESILSGLQLARIEAVRHNVPVVFTLRPAASPTLLWSVGCVAVVAGSCPALIQGRSLKEGSAAKQDGTLVVAFSVAPNLSVVFDSFGRKSGGGAFDVTVMASEASVQRPQRVIVETGGASRMCDTSLASGSSDPRACP